jgi:uncharacterized membrane protein HdeD (DUF308 family)
MPVLLSILMIVAGVVAIVAPVFAGLAVAAFVGWLLVVSGVLHLAFGWRGAHAAGVLWEVLLGIVYGAAGLYLLSRPLVGLVSLTLVLAVYLFVEGALELVLSIRLRPAPGAGYLLVDAIVTFVIAAIIWSTWPSSSAWAIGMLVGVSMLFSGATRLMLSLRSRRVAV